MKNIIKTFLLLCAISGIMLLNNSALAQTAHTDFKGKWLFNESQSELNGLAVIFWGNGKPFKIDQTQQEITVDQSDDANYAVSKLNLGQGTAEKTVKSVINGKEKSSIRSGSFKWLGANSFSETLTDKNGALSYSYKVFTLSPDLKKLIIEAKITYNGTDYSSKLVYDKQ